MDNVTVFGFADEEGEKPARSEVELCEKWIKEFARARKTINCSSNSYSLKHTVERWSGTYISNGAFIQAALNLGYRYKRFRPNAIFNMSFPQGVELAA